MNDYPECDCFEITDHRRAICRGEARKPLNGPNSINAYRKKWGFDPIQSVSVASQEWTPRMKSRGLGDTIAKITSAVGIKPCGGCKGRQAKLNKWFSYSREATPRFVTTRDLMRDAHQLASMLPPDTSRIVGVARSGLCAASMVAMILHLPLSIVRQSTSDVIDGGNGWRLTGNTGGNGPVVVIDDTVMSGNSFKHIMPIVRATFPEAISAGIYVNPRAAVKPDISLVDLPYPHLLEWNLFNSIHAPQCATDFDGILCRDCPPGSDDDGEKYIEFITNAQPLYPVRRVRVPLVVTARIEKYRPQTEWWLKRNGIAVDKLVMHPAATLRERMRDDIAAFKARHYGEFLKTKIRLKPHLFIESDVNQAKRIAQISGGIVVCPAAGRCFP